MRRRIRFQNRMPVVGCKKKLMPLLSVRKWWWAILEGAFLKMTKRIESKYPWTKAV